MNDTEKRKLSILMNTLEGMAADANDTGKDTFAVVLETEDVALLLKMYAKVNE